MDTRCTCCGFDPADREYRDSRDLPDHGHGHEGDEIDRRDTIPVMFARRPGPAADAWEHKFMLSMRPTEESAIDQMQALRAPKVPREWSAA